MKGAVLLSLLAQAWLCSCGPAPKESEPAAVQTVAPAPMPAPEAQSVAAPDPIARESWERGRRLAWQGHDAEAATELRRALGGELGEEEPAARLLLAYSLQRIGDRVGAYEEQIKLLERFPQYGRAVIGGVEPACGVAGSFIHGARHQFPENPDIGFHAARNLACVRQYPAAREIAEQVVERWPEHEYAKLLLARLLVATQPSAEREGKRALALVQQVPERETPFNLETRAMVLAAVGDFENALAMQLRARIVADRRGAAPEWTKQRLWSYRRGLSAEVILDWDEGFF